MAHDAVSEQVCLGGRFSERLESVRKDAECTFGILKKRWRILKNQMLIYNKARIDTMVFKCAVLHNMLIAHDATDEWKDEDDKLTTMILLRIFRNTRWIQE